MMLYAWDILEIKELIDIDKEEDMDIYNLISKILSYVINKAIKKALYRDYIEVNEEIPCIKGKIDFKSSIKRLSFRKGRAYCIYDNFDHNILPNQIIKRIVNIIIHNQDINKDIKDNMIDINKYFHNISDIILENNHFEMVKINKEYQNYRFILLLCKFIYENNFFNEEKGEYQFYNFYENKMPILYEEFIRKFYEIELKTKINYKTYGKKNIQWYLDEYDGKGNELIPSMEIDILLEENNNRTIIIDAKFYKDTFDNRFNKERIKSSNLYQMFAYMKNYEKTNKNLSIEGILIYPAVKNYETIDPIKVKIDGHLLKMKILDLNKEWDEISHRLLDIIFEDAQSR